MNNMSDVKPEKVHELEAQVAAQKKEIEHLRRELASLTSVAAPADKQGRDFFQLFYDLSVREYESRLRVARRA